MKIKKYLLNETKESDQLGIIFGPSNIKNMEFTGKSVYIKLKKKILTEKELNLLTKEFKIKEINFQDNSINVIKK